MGPNSQLPYPPDNPLPDGACTCEEDAEEPCDYCQAMNLWAHRELYGDEDEIERGWFDWDDDENDEAS